MSIVLFCIRCAEAIAADYGSTVHDLESAAEVRGWQMSRVGWLCPIHARADDTDLQLESDGKKPASKSAELHMLREALERRRISLIGGAHGNASPEPIGRPNGTEQDGSAGQRGLARRKNSAKAD